VDSVSAAQLDAVAALLAAHGYLIANTDAEAGAEAGANASGVVGSCDEEVARDPLGPCQGSPVAGTVSHVRARPLGKGLAVDLRYTRTPTRRRFL
jgi:hypothetical protein